MNLVINASDAIGDRPGNISVHTSVMSADEAYLDRTFRGQTVRPGTFVALEVSDDGSGMSPETQKRIFEPFFTTKFSGRGLGLSAMLGILKSHNAGIRIRSRAGEGSSFKIFLPGRERPQASKTTPALDPDFGYRFTRNLENLKLKYKLLTG